MAFQTNPTSLGDLTPEQISYLEGELARAKAGTQQQQPAQAVTVTLPNGQQVTGSSEQINAAYQQYYAEQAQTTQQTQAGNQSQAGVIERQKFNQEEFSKKLVANGQEGMEYLFESVYGYDVGKALPLVGQGLAVVAQRLEALERENFLTTTGIPQTDFGKIDKFVTDRGWAKNPESYKDAVAILKTNGQLGEMKAPATPQPNPTPWMVPNGQQVGAFPHATQATDSSPFIPPNVGSSGAPVQTGSPIDGQALDAHLANRSADEILQMIRGLEGQAQGGYR